MSDDTRGAFDSGRGIGGGRGRWAAWAVVVLTAGGLAAVVTRALTGVPVLPVFVGTFLVCVGIFRVAETHVKW